VEKRNTTHLSRVRPAPTKVQLRREGVIPRTGLEISKRIWMGLADTFLSAQDNRAAETGRPVIRARCEPLFCQKSGWNRQATNRLEDLGYNPGIVSPSPRLQLRIGDGLAAILFVLL
jgi:hypothetical protein